MSSHGGAGYFVGERPQLHDRIHDQSVDPADLSADMPHPLRKFTRHPHDESAEAGQSQDLKTVALLSR
eukprot:27142-Eustigmatos_ZCMA.PRE.1